MSVGYFKNLLGDKYVLTDRSSLDAFGTDWTKKYTPNPSMVLLPKSTGEVSAILKYCNENDLRVVPSGGRTGLAGAAVAKDGEIVLSLNRMNEIEDVDAVGLTIRAQAGVTTQELQEAAKNEGLMFSLDLAAKGSCQIGGNVATNAGGVKLIRYGGTREQVLGVEVVLPDGQILDLNRALRKDNTGYDLKQLFLGSEGTLGIITSVTMKLVPRPRNVQLTLMALESFTNIPKILHILNQDGIQVTAFEFFAKAAHEKVLQYSAGSRTPFEEKANFYLLLEVEEGAISGNILEPLLEKIFEDSLISDAVISGSSEQFAELWGLRENITECLAAHGHVRKNDISLPIDKLVAFINDLEALMVSSNCKENGLEIVVFGHIGDGNLHVNYIADKDACLEAFSENARSIEIEVFKLVQKFRGSISAEHGVGLLKKDDLHHSASSLELELMGKIRNIFDPKGVLNPGKIFDA